MLDIDEVIAVENTDEVLPWGRVHMRGGGEIIVQVDEADRLRELLADEGLTK
jgi:alkylated DNA nucleotide flippase Atl1